ncbi:hypothetical protein SRB17_05600 [Streptomyces sp. RB17]|uniref:hypothetical protein n=1 Tax=Streptomyces sp. RB17 TaxID=2585197 RepID=UPI001305ED8D|nr:hypothetical protein [Streptomyces sp. RB17]MQY32606.1 hypothetical protein [Streptomyces sp. RB17]
MSNLEKAARDAVEAADNSQMTQQILAILAAQQLLNQQQPQQPAPMPVSRPIGLYVAAGIGGAVALSFLAMAAALLAIAVTVGAVSATVCVLVLRSIWRDYEKGK